MTDLCSSLQDGRLWFPVSYHTWFSVNAGYFNVSDFRWMSAIIISCHPGEKKTLKNNHPLIGFEPRYFELPINRVSSAISAIEADYQTQSATKSQFERAENHFAVLAKFIEDSPNDHTELTRKLIEAQWRLSCWKNDFNEAYKILNTLNLQGTNTEAILLLMKGDMSRARCLLEALFLEEAMQHHMSSSICHPLPVQLSVIRSLMGDDASALDVIDTILPSLTQERFLTTVAPDIFSAIRNAVILNAKLGNEEATNMRLQQMQHLSKVVPMLSQQAEAELILNLHDDTQKCINSNDEQGSTLPAQNN